MHLYIIYTVLTADTLPAVNLYHRYTAGGSKYCTKTDLRDLLSCWPGTLTPTLNSPTILFRAGDCTINRLVSAFWKFYNFESNMDN